MVNTGKTIMTGAGAMLLFFTLIMNCYATDGYPGEIHIDLLANHYEGVIFDHDLHVMVSEGCATCHHHTTGTEVINTYCASCHTGDEPVWTVSCQDCHSKEPVTAGSMQQEKSAFTFHDDKPDLKGAYHLSCLGCHQEMGAPTGCLDCHARTEAGDAFFRSGQFAPTGSAGSSGH